MPKEWLPGVTRLESTRRITMRGTGERTFTHHTMEAGYTWTALRAAQYLIDQASEAHFVLHPVTGDLVQLLPASSGARTLVYNALTKIPTNSHGAVHMQMEVVGYASRPWTFDLTDAGREALARLMAFLRSWDIPDRWCGGTPMPPYPGPGVSRFMPAAGESGHTGHACWRENTHGDPGAIAAPWTIAPPSTKPDEATTTRVQTALAALQYDLGSWGVDGSYGAATQAALDAYRADWTTDPAGGHPTTAQITTLEADVTIAQELRTGQEEIKAELKAAVEALQVSDVSLSRGLTAAVERQLQAASTLSGLATTVANQAGTLTAVQATLAAPLTLAIVRKDTP